MTSRSCCAARPGSGGRGRALANVPVRSSARGGAGVSGQPAWRVGTDSFGSRTASVDCAQWAFGNQPLEPLEEHLSGRPRV